MSQQTTETPGTKQHSKKMMESAEEYSKMHSWPGWTKGQFGLELQSPFAEFVLNGRKKIETRAYALPTGLLSCDGHQVKVDILESKKGKAGVSSIPNRLSLNDNSGSNIKRRGWCTFTKSFRYKSNGQFEADADKHLVDSSSGYSFTEKRRMYGWVVGSYGFYDSDDDDDDEYIAERRMRSLFELTKKSTILITGASGMLGRALHRLLLSSSSSCPSFRVIGTGHTRIEVNHYPTFFSSRNNDTAPKSKPVKLHQVNLLDFDATTDFIQKYQPDVIVHCAAERYPDAFDTKLEESMKLNVESTRHLAKECQKLAADNTDTAIKRSGPYLIYISTSYVFDGGIESKEFPPYKPQSKVNPLNNYGKSKWEGECVVRDILNNRTQTNIGKEGAVGGRGIVVRVPLLYGEDCCELSESPALELMEVFLPSASQQTKKKIDHWAPRFPTSVEDVARVLKLMIDQIMDNKFPAVESLLGNSTYHVASPHATTKYELMQLQSKLLNIPTSEVEERTEADSSGPPTNSAPRPQCTQLDCSQTWKALGLNDGTDDNERQQFEFISLEDGMKRALNRFPERFTEA